MIVDQMFIANNLTIFQPLSDQYFDSTPMTVVKQEIEEEPVNDENIEELVEAEEQKEEKKSKKTKKNKKNKKLKKTNNEVNLNNEDLYYSNDDEMYYNQYYNQPQQQRPDRYNDNAVSDTYGDRGYDFQEPTLNNDYNFSVEAFNS